MKHISILLCLASIAALVRGSETDDKAVNCRERVFRDLFTPTTLSDNAENVLNAIPGLAPNESYARVAAWVLPSSTHADLRLDGNFAKPTTEQEHHEPVFRSPAILLVEIASQLGRLRELENTLDKLSAEESVRSHNLAAMRLLVALAKNDTGAALELAKTIDRLFEDNPTDSRYALLTAGFACLEFPAVRDVILGVVRDEQVEIVARRAPYVKSRWAAHIATLSGLLQYRSLTNSDQQFGMLPERSDWCATSPSNLLQPSQAWLGTHWQIDGATATCLSGNADNLLIYSQPLLGDFEVSGKMSDYAFNSVQIMYAGKVCKINGNRRKVRIGNLRLLKDTDSSLHLPKPSADVSFSLRVSDSICTVTVSGEVVWEFVLPPEHDPWFAIRCVTPFHGRIHNVRIHGTPQVPDVVRLLTDADMNEWLAWSGNPVKDDKLTAEWQIANSAGERTLVGMKRADLQGTQSPRLLSHYRPMIEDGTVEYDFFYEPGESSAHPAIGDLAFIVQPKGVLLHHVADESRSTWFDASATSSSDRVQLKPGDWNSAKIALVGNTVQLSINGSFAFTSELPANNSRTIGLFYFCDETNLLVRNMLWTGNWQKTLPSTYDQQLASKEFRNLDASRKLLPDVFSHDFVAEGAGEDYFQKLKRKRGSIVATDAGMLGTANSLSGFVNAQLKPAFELHGDFDITTSFDRFSGAGPKDVCVRLKVHLQDTELRTTRAQSGSKSSFKSVKVKHIENKRRQEQQRFSTAANSGRLRLARRGSEYTMAFAEGSSAAFQLLEKATGPNIPVTPEDWGLQVTAASGGQVSAVLKDVHIAAEKLFYVPPESASGRKGIYVLTVPDIDLSHSSPPLWERYCDARMNQYKLFGNEVSGLPISRMKNPLLAHGDLRYVRGLIYLWTQNNSRPVAIGSIILHGEGNQIDREVNEFHSFHDSPLSMTLDGEPQWSLSKPGIDWKVLSNGPKPAKNVAELYAQGRAIAKRFRGMIGKPEVNLPLRDEPLYEYSFVEQGRQIGGIITSFVQGKDPEVLLCLEVRKAADGNYLWHFAGANYTNHPGFLSLNDKVVWSESPARFGKTSPHRGWFPFNNLKLEDAYAAAVKGKIERVFDLPDDKNYVGQPEWASDGKSLVFHRSGLPDGLAGAIMGRLDLQTKTLTDIGKGCMPCLSPDRKQLVFNRLRTGVMRSNADGTNEEVLDRNGWAIGWSPNGKYLVWGNRNNCTLLDIATGTRRSLLSPNQSAQIAYMHWNISWSADSRLIAFNAVGQANEELLVATNINSPEEFRIVFKGNIRPDISWHPDNEHITFALNENKKVQRLYLIHRSNATAPRLLPGQPPGFRIQDCDWSPDGKKIAFSAFPKAERCEWSSNLKSSQNVQTSQSP